MTAPLPTERLYLQDDSCDAEATVVAVRDDALAFDRTCFYPGGGGQPPDDGRVHPDGGAVLEILAARADPDDVIWHIAASPLPPDLVGRHATLAVNRARRLALTRHHTVLHVLNTIALRDYGAWITGVQIGTDYSRIDFKLEGFSAALCTELEDKVNAVLQAGRALRAFDLPEEEFRRRTDLLRTLEVRPAWCIKVACAWWRSTASTPRPAAERTCTTRRRWAPSRSSAPRTRDGSTSACTSDSIRSLDPPS
jgi:misacylated tRNA(Ala) deacylase